MTHMTDPVLSRLDQLATDIRRLRARTEPGTSLAHTADRIADHAEWLHAHHQPTAAELANAYTLTTGRQDIDLCVTIAVETVDREAERYRQTLTPPGRTP
jgi:hypothetical protein